MGFEERRSAVRTRTGGREAAAGTQPARWVDDARPGDRRRHPLGRTVTEQDNVWLSLLTGNQNPIHVDAHHSAASPAGARLVESVVTIGVAIGLAQPEVGSDELVDLELRDVQHVAPVLHGDSLVAESELLDAGGEPGVRRRLRTRALNQRGEEVVAFERVLGEPPRAGRARQRQDGGPVQENASVADEQQAFGRYLEEFHVGDVYRHWPGRTITEFDDTWFSLMTMNQHPLHIDEAFASESQHGQRLVNGLLVMATAVGMSVPAVSGKAIANLGYESVRHEAPTFHGDTIYAETTVLDVRRSSSKPDRGVVHVETRVRNQRDEQVMTLQRRVLVPTREAAAPAAAAAGEARA
jgi:acyl dehydratase